MNFETANDWMKQLSSSNNGILRADNFNPSMVIQATLHIHIVRVFSSGIDLSYQTCHFQLSIPMSPKRAALLQALVAVLLLQLVACISTKPPNRSARKIALLHMHDGVPFFHELGALTLSNKLRYAIRHGYELAAHSPHGTEGLWTQDKSASPPCKGNGLFHRGNACYRENRKFQIDKRAATFGKIKLALAACQGREGYWVLWSDADALIVNQSVELESVIDDRYDILVSVDWLMINAGVMLFKCSLWTESFLKRVYAAREFDKARALDQSAFQHFFDEDPGTKEHVKFVPKYAINVYVEEYRPGDFLLHMAGKLYEATTAGAIALAHQFDVLSMVEHVEDVAAFFRSPYVLNMYSGICTDPNTPDSECQPGDPRRLQLKEPLQSMSTPKRYRHVALRYYWMPDWTDKYDTEGWNNGRKVFDPSNRAGLQRGDDSSADEVDDTNGEASHDEL